MVCAILNLGPGWFALGLNRLISSSVKVLGVSLTSWVSFGLSFRSTRGAADLTTRVRACPPEHLSSLDQVGCGSCLGVQILGSNWVFDGSSIRVKSR